MLMKIEKNNHYFNIAVYVFLTCIAIVITTCLILNIKIVVQFIWNIVGIIYILFEPLVIGIVIAYLLDPIVDFYDKKWHSASITKWYNIHKQPHFINEKEKRWHMRTVPTLLTFLSLFCFAGLFVLLIGMNIEQVSGSFFSKDIKGNISYYVAYFEKMISNVTRLFNEVGLFKESTKIIEYVYGTLNQLVINIYTRVMRSLSDVGLHAMNWLLALVIAFYLLQDKARCLALNNHLWKYLLKKHYEPTKSFAWDVDQVFAGYIRGEVIDSIIMTILTSAALMIVRLDFAIIIGIISGIFNLIPYFGPIVGFSLAIIIGLLDTNPMKAVYGAIAIIIIQQIDGWIIVPRIVGDCVKLHPVVVLLAILIGGNLFGLIGMLLAVPVTALIRLLLLRMVPELFKN